METFLKRCFIFICLLSAALVEAQTTPNTDFWLAFLRNYNNNNNQGNSGGSYYQLNLFVASTNQMAHVTISAPNLQATPIATITLSPNSAQALDIPLIINGTPMSAYTYEVVQKIGIHVQSDAPIAVYGLSNLDYSTDGFLSIPTNALGNNYIIAAPTGTSPLFKGTSSASEFIVVATQNNTTVSIVPKTPTINHPAGVLYNATLNAGETYFVQGDTTTGNNDLTGTSVNADKQIAVFGGSACTDVPLDGSCAACNHIVEAIPPLASWGNNYYTAHFAYKVADDMIRLTSSSPGITNVNYGGTLLTLNGLGDHQDVVLSKSTGGINIKSDQPILVMQLSSGNYCDSTQKGGKPVGDPAMLNIIPESRWNKLFTFSTPLAPAGGVNHFTSSNSVTILKKGTSSVVNMDGIPIPASNFKQIASTGYYYTLDSNITVGSHYLTSAQNFICYAYGFANADAYAYACGILNLGCSVQLSASPANYCINSGGTTLTASFFSAPAPTYSYTWASSCGNPALCPPPPNISGTNTPSYTVMVSPSVTTTYYVTITNDSCNNYASVEVKVNPLPIAGAGHNRALCAGDTAVIGATAQPGINYAWTSTPLGFTSNIARPIVSPTVNTTYTILATDAITQCSAKSSVVVVSNPLPIANAGTNKILCEGADSIPIGSPPVVGVNYNWTSKPIGFISSKAQPKVAPTVSTTYFLVATDNITFCSKKDSTIIAINPKPAISGSSSPSIICFGATSQLQCTTPNLTKSWYILPNTITPIGIGVSISVSPSITSTYAVVGTDAAGCSGSASVVVTVNPLPSVLIEAIGKDTLCVGDALTLLGINATTYAWTSSTSGATVIATGNTLNINPTLTTTYTLTGTDGNGCSNTYKKQIVVNPLPAPTLVVSNSPLCPGDSSVLRVQDRAHYTFVWSIQGTTNTPLSTPIDSTIKVGPTLTTIYAVQATNKLTHCVGTTTFALIVNPKPQPQGISGFTSVCPGQTGLSYSMVNPSSGSSYTWLVKGGYKPAGQLQTTATIQINWNNAVDLHGYVKVVEQNSYHCKGDTITLPVTIDYNLHPPLPLGSDSLCSHDVNNSLYQVIPVAGYTYTWMVQGGTVAGTAGLNDCQVSVNWDANTGIAHTLSYSETNGTCYGVSLAKTVRIDPSPAASMVVGLSGVCKREQTAYTLNDLAGSTYSWHLSQHTRAVIVGNQTGPQVLINWPDTIHPTVDTLFVVETSNKGCVGPLLVKPITITPPHQPAKILGADFVCVGSNPANAPVVLYTAHLGLATSRYVWTVIGADKVADSKDSVLSVRFTHVTPGGYVTLNVYELSKDSCPGLTVSKQVKFDYTTPYMQQVTTQISNAHYLQVRWDSSFNANGVSRTYRLYRRRLHGNGAWTDLGTLYANSYLDTVVNTGQYAYQYGYSTLDLCEDTVKAPVHNSILLQATAQEASNMVVLNWTPYQNWRGGVQQYELWRKLDQEHDYTRYRVLTGSDTVVSYQNGADGFKHSYRVLAVEGNTGGQSRVSWSNTANVSFEHLIDIPTVITPNGDGVNDTWVIKNIETYKNVEVQVFNRWGNEVFHNSGLYANPWNGTANGQQLPDGAYFFVIKLNQTQANTNQNVFQGTLSIIR